MGLDGLREITSLCTLNLHNLCNWPLLAYSSGIALLNLQFPGGWRPGRLPPQGGRYVRCAPLTIRPRKPFVHTKGARTFSTYPTRGSYGGLRLLSLRNCMYASQSSSADDKTLPPNNEYSPNYSHGTTWGVVFVGGQS